ncbi:FkbM family methyltransferase [Ahniella affigens]|uniref:FkbM family methyltransferase n=1 Tax=Ahniella affigens TaxID=2021234 RepID=A0A2P1PYI9_9GAMM|nr:FkbM family methyltransferase [Ahniella affigens]AVP99893.1 FkbM family methyltransferase [Ahniella affigens]
MIDPRVTWAGIRQHPLARQHPWRAVWNVLSWQLRSRLLAEVHVAFADRTVLKASRAMTGLTGNVYFGLHEYESMSFALHLLSADDLFVDVGANAGSYTVLAAGVRAAKALAIEPDSAALAALRNNVDANGLGPRVEICSDLIGDQVGQRAFSTGLDTINHVLSETELKAGAAHVLRSCTTLDRALGGRAPTLIKIDVEGEEVSALRGAVQTLAQSSLLALIVECSADSQPDVRAILHAHGFEPARYRPDQRQLERLPSPLDGNTLYVRWHCDLQHRLTHAPAVRIHPLSCLV